MNLSELQADLRHFAAERDWQPFHTPKNLATALIVEAAELAEIFQWMTSEESIHAHQDTATKERIGQELADVLLYLLQVADHTQVDIARAVQDKLARNAMKYPRKQTIARISSARDAQPGTHVLLDYENVQPTETDLRAMVPDASRVLVFHGPHQRHVEQRFASFGADVTAVPISKTGKNALDFHLSFYMGYIASRNQASPIVVVANDKGYEPMLQHAKAMGFAVRQQGHRQAQSGASRKAPAANAGPPASRGAKKAAEKKAPPRKVPVKQPAAKQPPAKKTAARPAAKKVPAKKVGSAKKAVAKPRQSADNSGVVAGPVGVSVMPVPAPAMSPSVSPSAVSTDLLKKITDSLWKMGDKRPAKSASLRRTLKSFLGAETGDESIEVALGELIAVGVILLGSKNVSYPGFAGKPSTGSASA